MLSESEATAIGSTVSGSGTNIASAYGTSTTSDMNPPPSRPASGPSPYIAINGSEPHELVTPRRHSRQVPQLSWNGTTTRSPALNPETDVTDRDNLRYAFMSDRVSRRQRRSAPRHRDVEVAAGHRQRPDQRLLRLGDLWVGDVTPSVSAGLFERQLPHSSILE